MEGHGTRRSFLGQRRSRLSQESFPFLLFPNLLQCAWTHANPGGYNQGPMNPIQSSLLSITETPNELTRDIDMASPAGIVQLLRQSDAQMFVGYSTYPGLMDPETLEQIERCTAALSGLLRFRGRRRVVIAGAGTSGRLATFVCQQFNERLKRLGHEPLFQHLMAGGSPALIKAKEGAEDDPKQAVVELKQLFEGVERGVYIGVTCGFSAPYIAGQLDYCMDQPNVTLILLGFNPVERARNTEIENWDKTFRQVAERMVSHPRALLLNPVVGPEPITGSTRMKGGSATKLLLDVVLALSLVRADIVPKEDFLLPYDRQTFPETIWRFVYQYEQARVATYQERDSIARLVELGATSLRREGHIYYLGQGASGLLGLIDASECPPTFGADFGDVRGFVDGGWETLLGLGEDISHIGPEYRITPEEFDQTVCPTLGPNDLVVGLGQGENSAWLDTYLKAARYKGARVAKVLINPWGTVDDYLNIRVGVTLEPAGFFPDNVAFGEFATKLVINALTTGAHVLCGKVYENRMIDLKISNNKLYYRTLGIIRDLMGVDEATAKESLVRSIFAEEKPTPEQRSAKVSTYVERATGAKKIVPRALLLATGKFTLEQAARALQETPIVRVLVEKYASKDT